jgi:hypothetical protein
MKKILFGLLLLMPTMLSAITFTQEGFFDGEAQLVTIAVPSGGVVHRFVTANVGVMTWIETSTKVYVNLNAVTPNAESFMFSLPAGMGACPNQVVERNKAISFYPNGSPSTVNITIQKWTKTRQ